MTKFTCSISDLCEALDLSETQIFNLARSGVVVKTGRGQYDLVASVKNYYESKLDDATGNPESLIEQRTRLTKFQADLAHIQLQAARRESLPVHLVKMWINSLLANLRSQLLAIPSNIAVTLPHIEKSDVLTIDELIRSTLTEASKIPAPRDVEKAVNDFWNTEK